MHVLKGISLTVEKGEVFGVIGRSGAGKSTLVRCINLLERPPPARWSSRARRSPRSAGARSARRAIRSG